MSSLVPSAIKSPEQRELEEKHRLLDGLESDFATRQLEYSTLAGEIGTFRNHYYLRVGSLYARLDAIRVDICEILARTKPHDAAAHIEAEQARQQAKQTFDEVNSAVEDEPVAFQPPASLKQIYRQAAKLIHPDRARNEEDRQLRDRLMAQINAAYAAGDADAIQEIIDHYRDLLNAVETDDIGAQLVRAIRSIARTRERITSLSQAIDDLKASEWSKLKADVEEAAIRGDDLLGQLAEKLHATILEEQKRFSELLSVSVGDANATEIPEPTHQSALFRPEGLIHRTERGEMVRSKSEVIIANILHNIGLDYRYEYPIEGSAQPGIRRPDFVFFDANHKAIIWEHLGMLDDPEYRARWDVKRSWYEANGFVEGTTLFITRDEADGALDSQRIRKLAEHLQTLIQS